MTDFGKEEFWKALGRLYDATENLRIVAVAHEKRLDRLDVLVEWLTEEQRKRDKNGAS